MRPAEATWPCPERVEREGTKRLSSHSASIIFSLPPAPSVTRQNSVIDRGCRLGRRLCQIADEVWT